MCVLGIGTALSAAGGWLASTLGIGATVGAVPAAASFGSAAIGGSSAIAATANAAALAAAGGSTMAAAATTAAGLTAWQQLGLQGLGIVTSMYGQNEQAKEMAKDAQDVANINQANLNKSAIEGYKAIEANRLEQDMATADAYEDSIRAYRRASAQGFVAQSDKGILGPGVDQVQAEFVLRNRTSTKNIALNHEMVIAQQDRGKKALGLGLQADLMNTKPRAYAGASYTDLVGQLFGSYYDMYNSQGVKSMDNQNNPLSSLPSLDFWNWYA